MACSGTALLYFYCYDHHDLETRNTFLVLDAVIQRVMEDVSLVVAAREW
jgi:hypothetical protein